MAPRRRRITPELMEALQLLKFTIRKGPSLSFTDGLSWDDEVREFEYMARTAQPEDADSYGRNLRQAGQDEDELDNIIEEVTKAMEDQENEGSESGLEYV
ncbi:hypothetical protein APHAL10511_002168 [Amanita phalloides]|nr:hypothetical protein APHAL10511_002168 [Amanita phalloides]